MLAPRTETILVQDERSMRRATECATRWMRAQPDHAPGRQYGFIVGAAPDGRIILGGIPAEALPAIRRAGVDFELTH